MVNVRSCESKIIHCFAGLLLFIMLGSINGVEGQLGEKSNWAYWCSVERYSLKYRDNKIIEEINYTNN